MRKFFAIDSPLMVALGSLADLVFCNILFCLCSLPLFTAGAALTALYDCTISIVEEREDPFIFRQFWRSFRANFRQGTALGLVCTAIFVFLWGYYLVVGTLSGGLRRTYQITFLILALLWLAIFQYIFPLQAKFRMKVGQTMKTAALLSATALDPDGLGIALFLWFFAIFAIVAYLNSFLFRQAFKRLALGPG